MGTGNKRFHREFRWLHIIRKQCGKHLIFVRVGITYNHYWLRLDTHYNLVVTFATLVAFIALVNIHVHQHLALIPMGMRNKRVRRGFRLLHIIHKQYGKRLIFVHVDITYNPH